MPVVTYKKYKYNILLKISGVIKLFKLIANILIKSQIHVHNPKYLVKKNLL